jgi:hypothetical protein
MPASLTRRVGSGDALPVTTSQILFLTGLLCGVFFAGVCLWAQRTHGSFGRRWWTVPGWILLGGAAFGAAAFLIDSGVAEKTLFEAEVPGSTVAVPAVLEWEIPVEHPGALHELGVYPNSDRDVDTPAAVHVQLADPVGRVLIDRTEELEPRCDDSHICDWDGYSSEFRPGAGGDLRLTVTVLTPDVPTVHVRVGDEEKTDGRRIPGY